MYYILVLVFGFIFEPKIFKFVFVFFLFLNQIASYFYLFFLLFNQIYSNLYFVLIFVFDVIKSEREELEENVKSIMENVIKIKVPLTVDVGIGKTWLEAH